MILAKKKHYAVHVVRFMGLDLSVPGALPDGGAAKFYSATGGKARSPSPDGWCRYLTPAENLALIARSLEDGK